MKNKRFVYSGSFNPLHEGHLSIAHYIEKKYGVSVEFEICKVTLDKEPLSESECSKRLKQFTMLHRKCHITNDATFLEKTISFRKGSVQLTTPNDSIYFIVGMDTFNRIDDTKYYLNSQDERDRCLKLINNYGGRFIVFPRVGVEKHLPSAEMNSIVEFVTDFTPSAINSTEIRSSKEPITEKVISSLTQRKRLYLLSKNDCFLHRGNPYKVTNVLTTDNGYTITVYNGEEFYVMDGEIIVLPIAEIFWPSIKG